MKIFILVLMLKMVSMEPQSSPAFNQIVDFKRKTQGLIYEMTTGTGAPIEYKEATNTLNKPLLLNNYFMESLIHTLREKIPERVVHAKAAGAFGYFVVTHNFSNICKADIFSAVGKKTPVAARFSLVHAQRGGADLSRDARGFALKFYTKEGNWDIVGFNTQMYLYKDPLLFTTFTHASQKNPVTNLIDGNTFWDFLTLRPESIYMFLSVFGDIGIPDGYRHMPGFGIHTFQVYNKNGDQSFVRFHFSPCAGVKNLSSKQAMKINGVDPDYATRDLYNAIGRGDFPRWNMSVQVLSLEDVKNASFDVFDVTKVLPQDKYSLRPVGYIELNRNPRNYFAEVEQLALSPANLVPGMVGAPDKLFESRLLAYRDAQNYRLGANFERIPVNCPMRGHQMDYNRDGRAPVSNNGGGIPNYYPNSFYGPAPYRDDKRPDVLEIYQDESNNFDQARNLYENEMTKEERSRLIGNILYSLRGAISELQDKATKIFKMIHPDLGNRVQQGLIMNRTNY